MTPWHYRWLCQFSYIDLPGHADSRRGQTLDRIARDLLSLDSRNALACGRLSQSDRETLSLVADTPALAQLRLVDFINQNGTSGFVAYAFRASDDSIHCIFRGSESPGCGAPSGIDWLDNVLAPFFGSVQYPEIAAFARRFPDSRVTFSGHSKGAHNALYALAVLPNNRASAVVFNGQGFAPGQLSRHRRARLARQAVHYVVRGDLVGCLLSHPERRIFVRRAPDADSHSLAAFSFAPSGRPIPALRPLWSYPIEWATCRAASGRPLPAQPTPAVE